MVPYELALIENLFAKVLLVEVANSVKGIAEVKLDLIQVPLTVISTSK